MGCCDSQFEKRRRRHFTLAERGTTCEGATYLKYDLENRLLVAWRSPDLRDLQARLRDEGPPLAIGALQPLRDGQHVDVHHRMRHRAPLVGKERIR